MKVFPLKCFAVYSMMIKFPTSLSFPILLLRQANSMQTKFHNTKVRPHYIKSQEVAITKTNTFNLDQSIELLSLFNIASYLFN